VIPVDLPPSGLDAGYPASNVLAPDPKVTGSITNPYAIYDPLDDMGHFLPAIPVDKVNRAMLRRQVSWDGPEAPGTIVVETARRQLFFILPGGQAMRYGVGLGRQGVQWKGNGIIAEKANWPHWMPSNEMVKNQPNLQPFSIKQGGLVGGLNNPLGARALYISQNGVDTLYRVHGTPDWKSIGHDVSSGCVRMFNQDVIDLASRVKTGAAIIVR